MTFRSEKPKRLFIVPEVTTWISSGNVKRYIHRLRYSIVAVYVGGAIKTLEREIGTYPRAMREMKRWSRA